MACVMFFAVCAILAIRLRPRVMATLEKKRQWTRQPESEDDDSHFRECRVSGESVTNMTFIVALLGLSINLLAFGLFALTTRHDGVSQFISDASLNQPDSYRGHIVELHI